eukprot:m.343198 g.343198  ORF g.343198 m.343198 type:complete len:449 (-) comp22455_c0_seq1:4-1350(-)
MASLFYGLTCAAMSVRCGCYLLLGKQLHDGEKNTSPRPCWPIPVRMLWLCGRQDVLIRFLLPAMLTTFAIAAAAPTLLVARLLAAVSHTFFSMGCAYALQWGHGQYPVLYVSWALVLSLLFELGPGFEVAIARAAVTYLYLAAGLAKVCVPASASDYFYTGTMCELMSKRIGEEERVSRFNPLFPWLAQILLHSPICLLVITWGMMILELVAVPAMLLVCLPGLATAVAVACIIFHLGIWWTFSSTAGTMFFQLLGAYSLMAESAADGSELVLVGTWPWLMGAVIGLSPAICLLIQGHPYVCGENWPCTNCALFPWSDKQIKWVSSHLGSDNNNKVRLVLTTDLLNKNDMVGRNVISRGQKSPSNDEVLLHDAYQNLWNWTKVYPAFVAELNALVEKHASDPVGMATGVQRWLRAEKPLFDTHSWLPLTHVHVVEVNPVTKIVTRVIS